MLSNDLELTLRKALTIATNYKHEYATYEHLLLALVDDEDAKEIFHKNGVAIESFKQRLGNYLKHDLAELVDENVKRPSLPRGFNVLFKEQICIVKQVDIKSLMARMY